ncbi:MAG: efflux RND transporter periplasmic adaptor subunit [Gammaproteobacteria bacterium]
MKVLPAIKQAGVAMLCSVLAAGSAVAQYPQGDYMRVRVSRVVPTVSIGGTVVPHKEVTLAAQLPGRVEFLKGHEGDRYEKGTLLVALDDDELLAQRNNAAAQLANAEASLRNADVQYSRELYAPYSMNKSPGGMGLPTLMDQFFTRPMSGVVGNTSPYLERHADLYSRGTQVEQARNAILQAKAQIQQIDAKLRDARAKAPFDGVIVRKMIEVGDTVQPGQPLLKFADTDWLQIRVEAPARLVRGLEQIQYENKRIDADLDSGEKNVPVRVARIFPMADSQRHTVTVKFDLPRGTRGRPGMYATVSIPDLEADKDERILIPKSALVRRGSLPGVYVRNQKGEPELRSIRLGEQVSRDEYSVISGLNPDDLVLRDARLMTNGGWQPGYPSAPRGNSLPPLRNGY